MLLRRFLALLGLLPPRTAGLDNGLGRRPLMGWSSWNNYAMSVNQSVIHRTINSMVSTGLAKAGFEQRCAMPAAAYQQRGPRDRISHVRALLSPLPVRADHRCQSAVGRPELRRW